MVGKKEGARVKGKMDDDRNNHYNLRREEMHKWILI